MNKILLNIPNISFKKDFTIIYKGKEEHDKKMIEPLAEIKTSKEEFLRKLRYFKNKSLEINQIDEIYIHEPYSVKIFTDFINTIETQQIEINDQNYNDILELSRKYKYEELEEQLALFSSTRPDLQKILECTTDTTKIEEIDYEKEEKLSKNLDFCLQNQNFIKFPLPSLVRILNSPNRVLHDHHLLANFIKKIIEMNTNENECDEEKREYLKIILGCLDYNEMSNEELDYFLVNEYLTEIFNFSHMKERMRKLLDDNKAAEERNSKLEERLLAIEQEQTETNKMKTSISGMKHKLEKQEQIIIQYQQSQDKLEKIQQEQTNQIKELQLLFKKYEDLKDQFSQQQLKIEEYKKESDEMRRKNSKPEEYFKEMEKNSMDVKISAEVEKNQNIKGKIDVIGINKLDTNRSKYILNTKESNVIGESEYQEGTKITSLMQNFSFKKPPGTYFVHAFIVGCFGHTKESVSKPLTIKSKEKTALRFEYKGRVQSVKLDPGTYKLEVWGSSGGENNVKIMNGNHTFSGYPGKGGYSVGMLTLNRETTLYVYVGGTSKSSNGGWNGGGSASSPGAGGGGATDISLYGEEGSNEWNASNHLYSRIIVAGGGGASSATCNASYYGGSGGGTNGENNGGNYASGGTQTKGSGFGVGGSTTEDLGSGGGGGWYGGYCYDNSRGWGPGGGGGSGYVYTASTASNYPRGCKLDSSFYLANSKTISGTEEIPTASGVGTEHGHSGNGYAIITPQ